MKGILFFNFASCESLNLLDLSRVMKNLEVIALVVIRLEKQGNSS